MRKWKSILHMSAATLSLQTSTLTTPLEVPGWVKAQVMPRRKFRRDTVAHKMAATRVKTQMQKHGQPILFSRKSCSMCTCVTTSSPWAGIRDASRSRGVSTADQTHRTRGAPVLQVLPPKPCSASQASPACPTYGSRKNTVRWHPIQKYCTIYLVWNRTIFYYKQMDPKITCGLQSNMKLESHSQHGNHLFRVNIAVNVDRKYFFCLECGVDVPPLLWKFIKYTVIKRVEATATSHVWCFRNFIVLIDKLAKQSRHEPFVVI